MKVQPIATPTAVAPSGTQSQTAQDARARAIAALTGQGSQPPAQVVQNQSQVSAEEMTAIQTPETRQEDSVEAQGSEDTAAPEQSTETVETKPETPKDPALSRQFAQLARQEKALRQKAAQQEQALKAREQALAEREAKLTSQPTFDPKSYYSKDQIKQDALRILEEAGVTYDEVTQQALNAHPTDPRLMRTVSTLEQKIADLTKQIEDGKKSQEEQQTQAYQTAVAQIARDVDSLVKADDNFEMIRTTRANKDVVELIEETFKKDGRLMSVEEAANEVENYLIEEALKLAKAKKVQQKLSTVAPKTASSTAQTPPQTPPKQPQPMKTLTNATASTRTLSGKERAILAFNGQLKS